MNKPFVIFAPISIGELFDKLTILQIKRKKIEGIKLNNIENEIIELEGVIKKNNLEIDSKIFSVLKKINFGLWEIEDKIRLKDSKNEFDDEFIDLAKSVFKSVLSLKDHCFLPESTLRSVGWSILRFPGYPITLKINLSSKKGDL